MKARFAQVCAGITIAVFAIVTLLFVLRLNEAHERSVLNRQAHFKALSELLVEAYEAAGYSFENLVWERFSEEFEFSRSAGAVSIASAEGRLEYVTAQDMSYLAPATRMQLEDNQGVRSGRNGRYLLTRSPRETRFSETLTTQSGDSIHVEAVYPTLSNSDIFTLLRDSALILLSFAALTLVAALGLYLHSTKLQTEPQAKRESSLPKTSAAEPEQSADKPDHYSEAFENDLDDYLDDEDYLDSDIHIDDDLVQSEEGTNAPNQEPDEEPNPEPDQHKDKLLRRLSSEMERSTFNEEDLVLALVRSTPAESEHQSDTESERRVNESHLLDRLYSFIALEHAFKELTFTVDENIIAVIEPNNDLDGGIRRMENLMRKAETRAVAEGSTLHAGLSARAGRLTESPRLFKEAYTALRRAEHSKTRLMGFRPDPDLYRRFVAGETAGVESS